jgi:hypothetical protein
MVKAFTTTELQWPHSAFRDADPAAHPSDAQLLGVGPR